MKTNSCIILLPDAPVFNREAVPVFELMDQENSAFLSSTLYLNNAEVLEKTGDQQTRIFTLSTLDEPFIPLELKSVSYNLDFFDLSNYPAYIRQLNDRYFSKYSKNLVVFARAITLSSLELQKIFDLLPSEEDTVVIGKTSNENLSFLGFTKFHEELFKDLEKPEFNFDNYLQGICKHNYFVNVFDKGMYIKTWDDFKQLYSELSKKESLNYCSQKMHELFTHLFIEYKEQIK